MTFGAVVRLVGAVLRRPDLWPTALRQWQRTTPKSWWRRAPFLPVPRPDYVRFRLVTQYGDENAPIAPPDVIDYLSWCKQQDRLGRTAG